MLQLLVHSSPVRLNLPALVRPLQGLEQTIDAGRSPHILARKARLAKWGRRPLAHQLRQLCREFHRLQVLGS